MTRSQPVFDDPTPPREAICAADGATILTAVRDWFARFIRTTTEDDLDLLALWTLHTHLVEELYTSPRLQIDSTTPGSGKTTVLDHLQRLCRNPVQAATLSSPALIPRLLDVEIRTLLLDEVDRSLAPDRPNTAELLGILNSGYRKGATRPVLVPVKGGNWRVAEMPTFAPVALAGNAPNLPADPASRMLRILLMPDLDGTVEDSDWEFIESAAKQLHDRIAAWSDQVCASIVGLDVKLPKGCIGRSKEKWRPLARVAAVAGGDWPAVVNRLIEQSLAEDAAEREAGLKSMPPGVVALADLCKVWPDSAEFMPTRELVGRLIAENSEYWGPGSNYGKALTETRLGRLIAQAAKVNSARPGGKGPRGYLRAQLSPVWLRLRIAPPKQPGALGEPGEPGCKQQPLTGLTGLTDGTGLKQAPQANPETPTERRPGCVCTPNPTPCAYCQSAASKEARKPA